MPHAIELSFSGLVQVTNFELFEQLIEIIRCSLSSGVQGSSPLRTRFIAGRVAGAPTNRQSAPRRSGDLWLHSTLPLSRRMELRPVDHVPNTSNTSAFGLCILVIVNGNATRVSTI